MNSQVLGAYLAGWPNEFDRVAQRSILAWAGLAMGVIAAAFAYADRCKESSFAP